jgi:hypothetical protein
MANFLKADKHTNYVIHRNNKTKNQFINFQDNYMPSLRDRSHFRFISLLNFCYTKEGNAPINPLKTFIFKHNILSFAWFQ